MFSVINADTTTVTGGLIVVDNPRNSLSLSSPLYYATVNEKPYSDLASGVQNEDAGSTAYTTTEFPCDFIRDTPMTRSNSKALDEVGSVATSLSSLQIWNEAPMSKAYAFDLVDFGGSETLETFGKYSSVSSRQRKWLSIIQTFGLPNPEMPRKSSSKEDGIGGLAVIIGGDFQSEVCRAYISIPAEKRVKSKKMAPRARIGNLVSY